MTLSIFTQRSSGSAPGDEVLGRAAYLRTDRLGEFWIQVNDFCNLAGSGVR